MTVVGVIRKSARDLWPVVALMLLTCFVFTVLGMQLFGAILDPDRPEYAEHPYALKTRFDTFLWSFIQVSTNYKIERKRCPRLVELPCHSRMSGCDEKQYVL